MSHLKKLFNINPMDEIVVTRTPDAAWRVFIFYAKFYIQNVQFVLNLIPTRKRTDDYKTNLISREHVG